MSASKKLYVDLAKELSKVASLANSLGEKSLLNVVAFHVGSALLRDNAKFDFDKFKVACRIN